MGKTLAFWSPLAIKDMGILIVVTPLTQLGEQSVSFLEKAGIQSISISTETASRANFREIEDSHYRAIITSPEQLMKPGRDIDFALKLIGVIFDEAHCILVAVHVSTDHPNIKIGVCKIKYSLASYADLAFLIPTGMKSDDPAPPKFLVFFDSIQEGINATKYLQARLPPDLRNKVKWFNSNMTTGFKAAEVTNLVARDT
ncbi:hypothetical protein DFJ58DRAFT_653975 [Suillus subalutaceus]|uniref:uncharacterized protein n=1 Tax=Suillus subalutaceus TaxID=48586 RepID=UPI001B8821E9|nr:uncharacterized protein DFJ58DRAFT_653975 [Suillus subalutaceus]KAG1868334.1 hypothetical protein DFJ58DRAFT_653975 [Suillus subalutaceus]